MHPLSLKVLKTRLCPDWIKLKVTRSDLAAHPVLAAYQDKKPLELPGILNYLVIWWCALTVHEWVMLWVGFRPDDLKVLCNLCNFRDLWTQILSKMANELFSSLLKIFLATAYSLWHSHPSSPGQNALCADLFNSFRIAFQPFASSFFPSDFLHLGCYLW